MSLSGEVIGGVGKSIVEAVKKNASPRTSFGPDIPDSFHNSQRQKIKTKNSTLNKLTNWLQRLKPKNSDVKMKQNVTEPRTSTTTKVSPTKTAQKTIPQTEVDLKEQGGILRDLTSRKATLESQKEDLKFLLDMCNPREEDSIEIDGHSYSGKEVLSVLQKQEELDKEYAVLQHYRNQSANSYLTSLKDRKESDFVGLAYKRCKEPSFEQVKQGLNEINQKLDELDLKLDVSNSEILDEVSRSHLKIKKLELEIQKIDYDLLESNCMDDTENGFLEFHKTIGDKPIVINGQSYSRDEVLTILQKHEQLDKVNVILKEHEKRSDTYLTSLKNREEGAYFGTVYKNLGEPNFAAMPNKMDEISQQLSEIEQEIGEVNPQIIARLSKKDIIAERRDLQHLKRLCEGGYPASFKGSPYDRLLKKYGKLSFSQIKQRLDEIGQQINRTKEPAAETLLKQMRLKKEYADLQDELPNLEKTLHELWEKKNQGVELTVEEILELNRCIFRKNRLAHLETVAKSRQQMQSMSSPVTVKTDIYAEYLRKKWFKRRKEKSLIAYVDRQQERYKDYHPIGYNDNLMDGVLSNGCHILDSRQNIKISKDDISLNSWLNSLYDKLNAGGFESTKQKWDYILDHIQQSFSNNSALLDHLDSGKNNLLGDYMDAGIGDCKMMSASVECITRQPRFKKLGLQSERHRGTLANDSYPNGGAHAWNRVKIDGENWLFDAAQEDQLKKWTSELEKQYFPGMTVDKYRKEHGLPVD